MSDNDHVQIVITQDSVGVVGPGQDIPLILGATVDFPERIRFYTSYAGVLEDADDGSPEQRMAQRMFQQNPKPPTIAIGRCALPPTLVAAITVVNLRNTHVYETQVEGDGVTSTRAATAASDGSATNDEVVALLVTALNAVVGKNYTAAATGSVGAQVVTVTATAAGDWFSLEVDPDLRIELTHADPGLAADITAIQHEDNSWYGIVYPYASNACVKAIAAIAETEEKLYFADVHDTEIATVALSIADDTGEDLYDLSYKRTAPCYHPSPADMFGAGFIARYLATKPGKATAKFKTIAGVNPTGLTANQKTNLRAKRVNAYERVWGVPITWEGVCSDAGTFIDVTRNDDWVKSTMATRIFGTLAGNDVVPFTDAGIAVICNDVRSTLEDAITAGIYASYAIEVPKAADVSDEDKADRILPDIRWSAVRAGAVHAVKPVNGVISL